ncbi:MAG: hypothetical protein C0606_11390 [Hyphomicrobiales bacterium]|nr:MAG: hypothetical protein C0606_11390 [Hyphomicrobiales bacterium]
MALGLLGAAALMTQTTEAHHYVGNYKSDMTTIKGRITEAFFGNPHGHIMVKSGGTTWEVILGSAYDSKKKKLADQLKVGMSVKVIGWPHFSDDMKEILPASIRTSERLIEMYRSTSDR